MPATVLSTSNVASGVSGGVSQARAAAPAARLRWPTTPQHAQPRRTASQRHGAVLDRGSGNGGAGVLDRPGFETLGPGGGPATDSAGAKLDSNGGRGLGGGSWRVLLIDSDKHTEERCVDAITTVVPGTDEAHAANCFYTARSLGMAIVVSVAKEHAEHFCQQLWQRGLRVNMEPDATTI
ncbi:clp protease adaptor [Chlorella sorokiniana]|uniref:Clp protease adaptor n=1 Tax=Chlorella sorokiniana TaxID=3076 RepID=A0A2P6U0M0_CHLSO|nr:clp protease adaptor [Chlorella sorokiniana]|eukprot:PRW59872.1 clp protease adaptor [Chlorella sorokiniana]